MNKNVIVREDYLMGIRFWAIWAPNTLPKFELFQYVGRNPDNGLYYFISKRNKAIISRSYYQLADSTYFKPFLLDFKKIQEYTAIRG